MGKVIDITEKLSFEDNPKLKVKGKVFEVNADASTMLKVMQLIGDGKDVSPNTIISMYELMFSEADRKKIADMNLQWPDFQILVMSAISLVTGESNQGE